MHRTNTPDSQANHGIIVSELDQKQRWLRAIIRDGQFTQTAKLVATSLSLYHNVKTGRCDPAQGTLAESIGLRRRAVIDAVAALRDRGWIETHPIGAGHFQYTLKMGAACAPKSKRPVRPDAHLPVHDGAHPPVHLDAHKQGSGEQGILEQEKEQTPKSPQAPEAAATEPDANRTSPALPAPDASVEVSTGIFILATDLADWDKNFGKDWVRQTIQTKAGHVRSKYPSGQEGCRENRTRYMSSLVPREKRIEIETANKIKAERQADAEAKAKLAAKPRNARI